MLNCPDRADDSYHWASRPAVGFFLRGLMSRDAREMAMTRSGSTSLRVVAVVVMSIAFTADTAIIVVPGHGEEPSRSVAARPDVAESRRRFSRTG